MCIQLKMWESWHWPSTILQPSSSHGLAHLVGQFPAERVGRHDRCCLVHHQVRTSLYPVGDAFTPSRSTCPRHLSLHLRITSPIAFIPVLCCSMLAFCWGHDTHPPDHPRFLLSVMICILVYVLHHRPSNFWRTLSAPASDTSFSHDLSPGLCLAS